MYSKINPFNPTSVVSTNLFAGRTEQVQNILSKLESIKLNMPASFFIHGERGIGKTALVKMIKAIASMKDDRLNNLNLLTSYYAVENGQDICSVLQESVNKVADSMDKDSISQIGTKLGALFKNGKFEIGAYGIKLGVETNKNNLQKEITIKDQTVGILSNLIDVINEENLNESKPKKDGILIIIDEMHNLSDITSTASILRNIITTLDVDNKGKISFLLVGYNEDIEKFFSKDSSARRTFDLIALGAMPDKEAEAVLIKGFEVANVEWDAEVLTKNISVAGGYPHCIQMIGHNLINADKDGDITEEDWDEATIHSALELKSKEFSLMYSFDKPLKISDYILLELTKINGPVSMKELNEKLAGKNVYQCIPKLITRGAVKLRDDKKIVLHSQLFRTAIKIDKYIRERNEEKE